MEAHFITHKHFRLDQTGGSNLYNYLMDYQCLKKINCKWFDQILSRLTVRWHCCCQHELLLLDADRVQSSKPLPT